MSSRWYWKAVQTLYGGIIDYIRNEKNSDIGRANLGLVILLIAILPIIVVPSWAIAALRLFTTNPLPSWIWALPLAGFIAVALVGYLSLKMIPREPQ